MYDHLANNSSYYHCWIINNISNYYSYQKKIEKLKLQNQLKESKRVTEREKIRVYIDSINEKYRAKRR